MKDVYNPNHLRDTACRWIGDGPWGKVVAWLATLTFSRINDQWPSIDLPLGLQPPQKVARTP